jgi:hypothetical protein
MKITTTLRHVIQDRPTIALWVANLLIVVITIIIAGLQIRPSELNVPTRYTTFGVTHIYNESWYYLVGFLCFMIAMFVLHTLIMLKLYDRKGILAARLFMTISAIPVIISSFYLSAIVGVASLLQ